MINRFLNTITMYRLVLWGLALMALYSFALALLGFLPYGLTPYLLSVALLLAVCFAANFLFAHLWKVETNTESWAITALILYFILFPARGSEDMLILLAAGALAMLSKYLLNVRGRHLFNPAALALFMLPFFGSGAAVWWIGSLTMLPATLILGLLVVRKVRKYALFLTFLGVSVATLSYTGLATPLSAVTSWPLVFFGSIMLTEPLTLPGRKYLQLPYAALIGVVAGTPLSIGPLFSTPESALMLGNLFAFLTGFKRRLILTLTEKKELARDIWEFSFKPLRGALPRFLPGQYLEWTIARGKDDTRGNRRYFTIASAPTEDALRIGVKVCGGNPPHTFAGSSARECERVLSHSSRSTSPVKITRERGSTFKQKLLALPLGGRIAAGALAGDFILPKNTAQKLGFIAGGIGVTPFRSMAQYFIDTTQRRDALLFYAAKDAEEFAYQDIFIKAQPSGLRTIPLATDTAGFLTPELITEHAPDFRERRWYLSGPDTMVRSYKTLLIGMGVPRRGIHTDYFPGY